MRAGVLCGRGLRPHGMLVIQRLMNEPLIDEVWVLVPDPESASKLPTGVKSIIYPPAALNKRGAARDQLRQRLCRNPHPNWVFLFDDDTLPSPNYFSTLNELSIDDTPAIGGGRLYNADGITRCWDICSFNQDHNPIVVPYDQIGNPIFWQDMYLSGPQIFWNPAGQKLNVPYPDLGYGEDTHYCWNFKAAGGKIVFVEGIYCTLLYEHAPANFFNCSTQQPA